MRCALCHNVTEGQEWVDLVIMGKKTPSQAAHHFGVTVDAVMEHIYEHTIMGMITDENRTPPRDPGDAPGTTIGAKGAVGEAIAEDGSISLDFYSNEIMHILAHLKRWARSLALHQASSTRDIDTGLKVMRELRLTVESLAEFQGRLASHKISNMTVNIDTMNMRYMNITNAIRTELCPTCRQKMLEVITLEASNAMKPSTQTITPKIISNTYQS